MEYINSLTTYNVPFEMSTPDRILDIENKDISTYKIQSLEKGYFAYEVISSTEIDFTFRTKDKTNYVEVVSKGLFKDRLKSYWFITNIEGIEGSNAFKAKCVIDVVGTFGAKLLESMEGSRINIKRMHENRYTFDSSDNTFKMNQNTHALINSDFKIGDTKGMELIYSGSNTTISTPSSVSIQNFYSSEKTIIDNRVIRNNKLYYAYCFINPAGFPDYEAGVDFVIGKNWDGNQLLLAPIDVSKPYPSIRVINELQQSKVINFFLSPYKIEPGHRAIKIWYSHKVENNPDVITYIGSGRLAHDSERMTDDGLLVITPKKNVIKRPYGNTLYLQTQLQFRDSLHFDATKHLHFYTESIKEYEIKFGYKPDSGYVLTEIKDVYLLLYDMGLTDWDKNVFTVKSDLKWFAGTNTNSSGQNLGGVNVVDWTKDDWAKNINLNLVDKKLLIKNQDDYAIYNPQFGRWKSFYIVSNGFNYVVFVWEPIFVESKIFGTDARDDVLEFLNKILASLTTYMDVKGTNNDDYLDNFGIIKIPCTDLNTDVIMKTTIKNITSDEMKKLVDNPLYDGISIEIGLLNPDIMPIKTYFNNTEGLPLDIYNFLKNKRDVFNGKFTVNTQSIQTSLTLTDNQRISFSENNMLSFLSDMGVNYLARNKNSVEAVKTGIELNRASKMIDNTQDQFNAITDIGQSAYNFEFFSAIKSAGAIAFNVQRRRMIGKVADNEKRKIDATLEDMKSTAPSISSGSDNVYSILNNNEYAYNFNWVLYKPNKILLNKITQYHDRFGYNIDDYVVFEKSSYKSRSRFNFLSIENIKEYLVTNNTTDINMLNIFEEELVNGVRLWWDIENMCKYQKLNFENVIVNNYKNEKIGSIVDNFLSKRK